ncbi:hypothetical protein AVEN_49983-1 [Araneus ventricosus]|uniref:Uncharacterized protein n=1 Tax=Araneus ventricosus TaxID=182803 RepID=A0A4Y2D0N1_ARAVE|nr:hypothetical protein AVEN_49983-1 [Araneus ventricosus]
MGASKHTQVHKCRNRTFLAVRLYCESGGAKGAWATMNCCNLARRSVVNVTSNSHSLNEALKQKRPEYGERHGNVVFQHHSAQQHIGSPIKETLEAFRWDVLPHPRGRGAEVWRGDVSSSSDRSSK